MNSVENSSLEHEWVNVGFIHEKIVCKHCDQEKQYTTYWKCRTREKELGYWEDAHMF